MLNFANVRKNDEKGNVVLKKRFIFYIGVKVVRYLNCMVVNCTVFLFYKYEIYCEY